MKHQNGEKCDLSDLACMTVGVWQADSSVPDTADQTQSVRMISSSLSFYFQVQNSDTELTMECSDSQMMVHGPRPAGQSVLSCQFCSDEVMVSHIMAGCTSECGCLLIEYQI